MESAYFWNKKGARRSQKEPEGAAGRSQKESEGVSMADGGRTHTHTQQSSRLRSRLSPVFFLPLTQSVALSQGWCWRSSCMPPLRRGSSRWRWEATSLPALRSCTCPRLIRACLTQCAPSGTPPQRTTADTKTWTAFVPPEPGRVWRGQRQDPEQSHYRHRTILLTVVLDWYCRLSRLWCNSKSGEKV